MSNITLKLNDASTIKHDWLERSTLLILSE